MPQQMERGQEGFSSPQDCRSRDFQLQVKLGRVSAYLLSCRFPWARTSQLLTRLLWDTATDVRLGCVQAASNFSTRSRKGLSPSTTSTAISMKANNDQNYDLSTSQLIMIMLFQGTEYDQTARLYSLMPQLVISTTCLTTSLLYSTSPFLRGTRDNSKSSVQYLSG